MQIKRLSGINGNLLTNNTLQFINLKGSNSDTSGYGQMFINETQVPSVNANTGLFVVVMDEYLNIEETRRFILTNTAATGRRDVDFINYMGTLPPRRYFAMISNNQIAHTPILDDFLNNILQSSVWEDMWEYYNTGYSSPQTLGKISYVAFGTTDLNITHESYAVGDNDAGITVNIDGYDVFMNTGYGKPLYTLDKQSYGSVTTTYTLQASDIHSGGIYVSSRYKNNIQASDIQIEKELTDGTITTYNVAQDETNIYRTDWVRIVNEPDVLEYRIKLTNVDLLFLDIHRCNPNDTINNTPSISKRGNGMSISSIEFSMNGYNFEKVEHLSNFASIGNIYDCPNTTVVNNVQMDSFSLNGSSESNFIEVNHRRDYFLSFFGRNNTIDDTEINIAVKSYDSDYNLVDSISLVSLNPSEAHNMGTITNSTQDLFYQEFYVLSSDQSINDADDTLFLADDVYGSNQYGGWSSESTVVSDIIVMNNNVKYITMQLVSDNDVEIINPICDIVKFALSKDSVYIGNVNES